MEVYNVGKQEVAQIMADQFEKRKIDYRVEKENKFYLPFENLTFEIYGSKDHAKLACIKEYKNSDCLKLVERLISELESNRNQIYRLSFQKLIKSALFFMFNFVVLFYFVV